MTQLLMVYTDPTQENTGRPPLQKKKKKDGNGLMDMWLLLPVVHRQSPHSWMYNGSNIASHSPGGFWGPRD